MLRTLATLASLAVVLLPGTAAARPSITIGEAVPFTAGQLADAVSLRSDSTATVRVTRRGDGLLVQVGDAAQTVALDEGVPDPHDTARVVALVVVALAIEVPPGDIVAIDEPEITNHPLASRRRPWAMRASLGFSRDDGGTFDWPLTGALSYEVAPMARLVGSITLGQATTGSRDGIFIPLKAGIEGRAGALGIEVGVMAVPHQECNQTWVVAGGGYATGRVYLPVGARTKLLVEAGGYYAFDQSQGCNATIQAAEYRGEAYGGHVGGGIEWGL